MKKRIPRILTQNDLEEISHLFFDYQKFRPRTLLGISALDTDNLNKDRDLHQRAQILHDHLSLPESHERKPLSLPWWIVALRKAREVDPRFQLPIESIAPNSTEFWKSLIDMNSNTTPNEDESEKIIHNIPLR